jgi:hypothetical protein
MNFSAGLGRLSLVDNVLCVCGGWGAVREAAGLEEVRAVAERSVSSSVQMSFMGQFCSNLLAGGGLEKADG